MQDIKSICNLNFHSSIGGVQHTLTTILPLLRKHFEIFVIDPYNNKDFKALLSAYNINSYALFDTGTKTYLSHNSGIAKLADILRELPTYSRMISVFRRFLTQKKIDLVYVNQTKAAAFAAVATPFYIPIIYHCHGVSATGIQTIKYLQSRFAHIIANSSFTYYELIKLGYDEKHISIATNTLPIEQIRDQAKREIDSPIPKPTSKPIILVAHAGIEPNKGTLLAINAFNQLVESGLPGTLWITGDVSTAHAAYGLVVKQNAASLESTGHIQFLGRRKDIYPVMAASDLVLVPSLVEESFGRVVAEAQILGKPVLVSNRGALPTLIDANINGKIFDPEDSTSLLKLLIEFINNPQLGKTFGEAGRIMATQKFNLQSYEQQLTSIFQQTLAKYRQ